jgi:hypothetical protein
LRSLLTSSVGVGDGTVGALEEGSDGRVCRLEPAVGGSQGEEDGGSKTEHGGEVRARGKVEEERSRDLETIKSASLDGW